MSASPVRRHRAAVTQEHTRSVQAECGPHALVIGTEVGPRDRQAVRRAATRDASGRPEHLGLDDALGSPVNPIAIF